MARVITHSPNVHEKGLKVHRKETIKSIIFYLFAAVYLLLVSAIYQKMTWYLASVYILLYIMYKKTKIDMEDWPSLTNTSSGRCRRDNWCSWTKDSTNKTLNNKIKSTRANKKMMKTLKPLRATCFENTANQLSQWNYVHQSMMKYLKKKRRKVKFQESWGGIMFSWSTCSWLLFQVSILRSIHTLY